MGSKRSREEEVEEEERQEYGASKRAKVKGLKSGDVAAMVGSYYRIAGNFWKG